jgi:hypothetical protein
MRSIKESICGPEWFAKQIKKEQETESEDQGYIFTPDTEDVE